MILVTLALRPEIAAHVKAQADGQRVSVATWIADRLAHHAGVARSPKSPAARRVSDAALDPDRAARIQRQADKLRQHGRVHNSTGHAGLKGPGS